MSPAFPDSPASDSPIELQFEINAMPFRVRVLDVIADNDPDAIGCITFRDQEIQILRKQTLASAFATLAHEVGHAWLGRYPETRLPTNLEAFCESFADVMPNFVAEFVRQGGMATLAEMMGLPHDGNQTALISVPWETATTAERQRAVIRHVLCWHLTEIQFEQYRVLYEARGLNPLLGDCYARKVVKDGRRISIELGTTIKAMRRIARRTGKLASITAPEWCGEDGVFHPVWPRSKGRPTAARIAVGRTDRPDLFWGFARFDSFAQSVEIDGKQILTWWWDKMDDHMTAKCAEGQAFGRAFDELDGLIPDEMVQEPTPTQAQARAIERRTGKMVREDRLGEQLDELAAGAAVADHSPTQAFGRSPDPSLDRTDIEPETEETAAATDAMLHQLILRVSKLVSRTKRDELIAHMRRKMGDVEDDNPPAFAEAVFEEAKARWGRAR